MTNTIYNTIEKITEYLNNLDDSELVNIHNEYCQSCNYSDNEIYSNDEEFFNTFFEGKVIEAVRAVAYGEYQYNNDYVIFNGYGNLESFDYAKDRVDISAIAEDIKENPENYYGIELEECFEIDGTWYEGSEEDALKEYQIYFDEETKDTPELDQDKAKDFGVWAAENLTKVNR